jgi:hypothetical protein
VDLIEMMGRYGYAMFPQQRAVYDHLSREARGKTVLEAGCGIGLGTAVLALEAASVRAYDLLGVNVRAAAELYPWVPFAVWDMTAPPPGGFEPAQLVVAVEAIEHVADAEAALRNLLALTAETLWVSTPNGEGRPRPPHNPFHVCEYSPGEMRLMIDRAARAAGVGAAVRTRHWQTFAVTDAPADPAVYEVRVTR